MGSYWLCTLPTSHSAAVQGQQAAEQEIQRDAGNTCREKRAQKLEMLDRNLPFFFSFLFFCFVCWDEGEHGSRGATWTRLVSPSTYWRAFPGLVRGTGMQKLHKFRAWCWNVVTTRLRFSLYYQQTFSPLGSFPGEVGELWREPAKSLIRGPVFSDHVPRDRRPHLISVKHDPAEEWVALLCLSERWSAEGLWNLFLKVCHAPQVASVCFFFFL